MEADRARAAGVPPSKIPKPGPELKSSISDDYPSDADGPDYWKIHIMELKNQGTLDEEIKHPMNMDWALTNEWLEEYSTRLSLQPAFVPRRGETVLWLYDYDGQLEWNLANKCYQIRNPDDSWGEKPQWRAGVITQTPEEPCTYLDINQTTKKEQPVNYSGFRVETLPDPLGADKSLSMQSTYIPLKCIRPFGAFARFIQSTPREQLHPSIEYAMITMASWSLLSHTRFHGTWPNARVENRGIFIGSELISIHDTVRLKPFGMSFEDTLSGDTVTRPETDPIDVMVVERIWLEMKDCDADPKSPQLAKQIHPYLAGVVYTRDPNRLSRPMPFGNAPLQKLSIVEVGNLFRQVGMHLYGDWYRVAAGEKCVVSPSMVLGRCYEPEASMLYHGDDRLDFDLHSILNGRNYSASTDARVPDGVGWLWSASRVETLGLATMNGIECGLGAPQRENTGRWQAILKILNGPYTDADIRRAELPRRVGRPSLKQTFGEVSKMSKLVSAGLGESPMSSDIGAEETNDDGDEAMSESNSEWNLTETELRAAVPFRGSGGEDGQEDYEP